MPGQRVVALYEKAMRDSHPPTQAHVQGMPWAGVGLKPQHGRAILESLPDVGFFEVHAENCMGAGGPPHRLLEALRAEYPISIHGVGLSLGTSAALDREHLARLKLLVRRYQPELVSEHLAWSSHGGVFLSDLLPLPYTDETLERVCEHVDEMQGALGCQVLLENPSTYVRFEQSDIPEPEFLAMVASRTGCGLLLDVTNVVVSATNHARSARAYLDAFPSDKVKEIHLAGYSSEQASRSPLLIDDHGSAVGEDVWALYRYALERTGTVTTLVEWDNNVPEWDVLLSQAQRADALLRERSLRTHPRDSSHAARLG